MSKSLHLLAPSFKLRCSLVSISDSLELLEGDIREPSNAAVD